MLVVFPVEEDSLQLIPYNILKTFNTGCSKKVKNEIEKIEKNPIFLTSNIIILRIKHQK